MPAPRKMELDKPDIRAQWDERKKQARARKAAAMTAKAERLNARVDAIEGARARREAAEMRPLENKRAEWAREALGHRANKPAKNGRGRNG